MVTLRFQQVPRDDANLYRYANPLIESWSGVALKGVPLQQTQVNDATLYAVDAENLDTTGSPTRKSLRAVAGAHSFLVNGSGITASSLTVTGALSAGSTSLGETTVDTLIMPFKTVGAPADPGAGLSRLYGGIDGFPYWFPNGGAAIKLLKSGLVVNADISASAAIDLSKLAAPAANTVLLSNGTTISGAALTNAFVSASAAIAYSKLNLTTSIVNGDVSASAAIVYSKLSLTGGIVNADVNGSAAIAYSKLNLATSIVNADVSGSAAIAYSKLNLTGGIVNADVSGSAAIAITKIAVGFAQVFSGTYSGDGTASRTITTAMPSAPKLVTVQAITVTDQILLTMGHVAMGFNPTAGTVFSGSGLLNTTVSGFNVSGSGNTSGTNYMWQAYT